MGESTALNRELRQKVEMSSETVTNSDIMQMMRQVVASVDTLGGEVKTLRGDVDAMRSDIDTMRGDMDALRGDMDTMRSDMDTMRGDINTLRNDMERGFIKVDARFNKVDTTILEVRSEQQSMALAQQGLSQEVKSLKSSGWMVYMGPLAAMFLFIVGVWYQNQTSADRYREFELMMQAQMAAPASRQAVPESSVQSEPDGTSPRR